MLNPLTLKVSYRNTDGELLLPVQTFIGPGTGQASFSGWTVATADQYFQAGKSYEIRSAKLSGYLPAAAQKVTFPVNPTPETSTLEVVFTYQRPELVLHYTFDDEKNLGRDSSVRGNHGQAFGKPSWDPVGRVGGAVYFDGKDDHFKMPASKSLAITNTLTISAWIRPEVYPADIANIVNLPSAYYFSLCDESLC